MNHQIIPYTKIIIPEKERSKEKALYVPVLETFLYYKGKQTNFSFKLNKKGIGLLGRKGFFDFFQEIAFNQQKAMFRLKGEGSRSFEDS